MDIDLIHHLEASLYQRLPGVEAQNRMAPIASDLYRQLSSDYKVACVLALLFPKEREWHISLIQRSSHHPEDKHAGQLSFPGGQLSQEDATHEDCALRETYEEIGVSPDHVGVLGGLTPLYIPVSNFLVHPYVGFTTEYPQFSPQEAEVSQILEVPVKHFLQSANKAVGPVNSSTNALHNVPYYIVHGHKLWGATAMIMSELEHVVMTCKTYT
jgi:8-oxo-dGTP pyrophosphatase MutT (NUDIX family)